MEAGKEQVTVPGEYALEGILESPDGGVRGGVVISHPHPSYGGSMVNPVVHHMARGCQARNLATLRFNFRGVGNSEGSYSHSREYRDVSAAARFLRQRLPHEAGIVLAGYSFGAGMSALAVAQGAEATEDVATEDVAAEDVAGLALVAFAVRWGEFQPEAFSGLQRYRGPVLALSGEGDDIAPPAEVAGFLTGLGLDVQDVALAGEDHMLGRSHKALEEYVGGFAAAALSPAGEKTS